MQEIIEEIETQINKPILLVISGPTCSGKDTVMRELLKRNKNMQRLVTTNSRVKRPEEIEGVDYHFVLRQEFERLIGEDAFYEWVEYRGEYRGGQKKHVLKALNSGKDVIWRIDVRGVKNIYNKVKKEIPNSAFIFLAESLPILEKRIIKRHTEDKKWQEWSIHMAVWELKQYKDFDYVVINKENHLPQTIEQVEKILSAERMRIKKGIPDSIPLSDN